MSCGRRRRRHLRDYFLSPPPPLPPLQERQLVPLLRLLLRLHLSVRRPRPADHRHQRLGNVVTVFMLFTARARAPARRVAAARLTLSPSVASGWIAALTGLNTSIPVGIIMLLIAALFTALSVCSLIMFKKVRRVEPSPRRPWAQELDRFSLCFPPGARAVSYHRRQLREGPAGVRHRRHVQQDGSDRRRQRRRQRRIQRRPWDLQTLERRAGTHAHTLHGRPQRWKVGDSGPVGRLCPAQSCPPSLEPNRFYVAPVCFYSQTISPIAPPEACWVPPPTHTQIRSYRPSSVVTVITD